MKSTTLKTKIMFSSLALTFLLGVSAAYIVRVCVRRDLVGEQLNKILFVTKHFSTDSEHLILTGEYLNLKLLAYEFVGALEDVEYAYVLSPDKTVLAHTFKNGFPTELKDVKILETGFGAAPLLMDGKKLVVVSAPVSGGELGTAYILASSAHIDQASDRAAVLLLEIIGLILAVGTFHSLVFSKKITKPLANLVEAAKQVSKGDLSVRTNINSTDEAGQLGSAFDEMLERLEKTVVSREAFQKQSKFLKSVIEAIPFPFYIVNASDYSLEEANKAAMDIGARIGETCHWATHKSDHPCNDENHKCPLTEIKETGMSSIIEHRHVAADGVEKQYEVHGYPIFDENGDLIRMIEFSLDISKRQETEKNLKLFKAIIDQSNDAMFVVDPGTSKFIEVNKAACDSLGYAREDMLKLGLTDIDVSLFDKQQWLSHRKDLAFIKKMTMESSYKRKDSSVFPVEVSVALASHEESQYLIGVARDVSERKETELNLLKSKAELAENYKVLDSMFRKVEKGKEEWEKTMDCIGDMVILTDAISKIRRCNKAFVDFLGLSYGQILGRPLDEILDRFDDVEGDMSDLSATLLHRESGKFFLFSRYFFKGEKVDHRLSYVITLHDFTERKVANDKLKEKNEEIESQNKKLQNILTELSSIIEKVGEEQNLSLRYINSGVAKCYETTGCQEKDCPCFGQEAMRCWQVAGTLKCSDSSALTYPSKLRNCIECRVFKRAAEDPIQQIGEQFNNMMQILECKNEELKKAYNDLENTHAQMLQSEKMASIGQLAAGIAHEINNPVGFISSNLDSLKQYVAKLKEFVVEQDKLLKSGRNTKIESELEKLRAAMDIDYILSDVVELVRESLEGTERVTDIVQNLKTFSHVDGKDYEQLDIHECIESTLKIVWNALKYHTVVRKDYGETPLTMGHPSQLNQVFVNLLVNAAQAIKNKGEITIKTWSKNGSIYASVSDTGCGMPKEVQNKIFDPFFTTKDVGKGTGLGLSISYDIVKKHNGTIEVESEVGKGTTFTVMLPVVDFCAPPEDPSS